MSASNRLAITGVRVWTGGLALPAAAAQTIRVEGQRIVAIGEGGGLADGCEVHAFPGALVMPGLIDAHVHLWLDPAILSPDDQAKVPHEERVRAMAARALSMLEAGITTARDLGGPDGSELVLRDRIAAGEIPGPRLLCAGQPLTTRRGHCWFWGGEAESLEEIDATLTRQVAAGCDWVKVMATGGISTRGTSPAAAQYDEARLRHIVARAAGRGRPVAAHAHGTEGIRNAARAGIDTVEHCSFVGASGLFASDVPEDVVRALAAGGTRVSPTVNAGWRRFEAPGRDDTGRVVRTRTALRRLREAGVPLIASTDAGIPGVAHDGLPHALPVFGRFAGLSALEVLRSATSVAADALGLGGTCGRIRAGTAADLLVLDGDPTRDLAALRRPRAVYARGRRLRAGRFAARG